MAAADGEEVVDVVGVFCLDARLDTLKNYFSPSKYSNGVSLLMLP